MDMPFDLLTRRYADESLSNFLFRQLEYAVGNAVLDDDVIEKRVEAIQISIREERGDLSLINESVIQNLHLMQAKYAWAHLYQKCSSGRTELKGFKVLEKTVKYHVMKAGGDHTVDSIGMTMPALKELYIRQAQLWLTHIRIYAEDPDVDVSRIPNSEIVPAVMFAGKKLIYIETSDKELGYLLHKNAMSILRPHIKELLVLSGHYSSFRVDDFVDEVVDPVLKRLKVSRKAAGLAKDSHIMKTAYTRQCKYNWVYFKKHIDRMEDPQKYFSESVLFYLEVAQLKLEEVEITAEDVRLMSGKVSKLHNQYKKERERKEHGDVVWKN